MTRTVLRGAYALLGSGFDFERRPLDVLVDGERISAIEPANSIHDAGAASCGSTTCARRCRWC